MSRPSLRRQRKAKKREQRKQAQKHELHYPSINLLNSDAPYNYVEALRRGLETFKFGDKVLFPKKLRRILQLQRSLGLVGALQEVCSVPLTAWSDEDPFLSLLLRDITNSIGQSIIRQVPLVSEFSPTTVFEVVPDLPDARSWSVKLSSLSYTKTSKGKIYHPNTDCNVLVRGVEKKIAYTSHAIDRISERSIPAYRSYGAMTDAHALFQRCTYFESVTIKNKDRTDSLGLSIFFPVAVHQVEMLRALFGKDPVVGKHYYWRVGYLPLAITDDYWVAKTLLLPGFRGTPEWIAVCRSNIPKDERQDILKKAQDVNIPVSIVQRFHSLGVPQVIETDKALFKLRPDEASSAEFDVYRKRAV